MYVLTRLIREKFHPLYALRRSKFFRTLILPMLDLPVACRLRFVKWKVYVRLVRNLSVIINSSVAEPGTGSLFVSICQLLHPQTFWDVGANIGWYAWLVLSLDDKLEAVLFEPDPDNAALIGKTLTKAGLQARARLVECAVSDCKGRASFGLDPLSSATGSLITGETFNERLLGFKPPCIEVETTTLDDVWQSGSRPPDLIKIDVEAAEHLVFAGAQSLIKQCQPIIVFECDSANVSSLTALLKDQGYSIVSADHPDAAVESSLNLLAVPSRHQRAMKDLFELWRRTYAVWENRPYKSPSGESA